MRTNLKIQCNRIDDKENDEAHTILDLTHHVRCASTDTYGLTPTANSKHIMHEFTGSIVEW